MNGPIPQLLEHYGTHQYMEKNAQPPAARIAAGALGFGMMYKDREHQQRMLAEARMMNAIARELEAKKMRATISSLESAEPDTRRINHDAPRGDDMDYSEYGDLFKGGSGIGKFMAKHAAGELTEMDKEALGGGMLGKMVAGAGKMVSGLGKGLRKGFTPTGRLQTAALSEGAQFAQAVQPGLRQRAGQALTRAGRGTQRAGIKMQRAAVPAVAGTVAKAAPEVAAKSKPLIGLGTKAKIGLGAGVLGVGYLGAKGVQGARDYMMQPTYSSQQWGHGNIKQQPSAYGY